MVKKLGDSKYSYLSHRFSVILGKSLTLLFLGFPSKKKNYNKALYEDAERYTGDGNIQVQVMSV